MTDLALPLESKHVVIVCGGAVAGSEAASLTASRGGLAFVFEQSPRPYGKIEDGLPRWHVKLREKEYARIDENLTRSGVFFVPSTRVGEHVSVAGINALHPSALVLAVGAWSDRPLPIGGADRFIGRGLLYQNALVHWFNHYDDPGYDGPTYTIPDGTVVIGGGLASIDVVKIVNLELYRSALARRGIAIGVVDLEIKGIDRVLVEHGLTPEALGVRGVTLYYRRRKRDMPLASADDPTPEQQKKLEVARERIMDKTMRKYLVHLEELASPLEVISDGDRLTGLRLQRNEVVNGRLMPVAGSTFEVRTDLVISSIGSIPAPLEGIPQNGELYRFRDSKTGEVEGFEGVYGLGNVLTGKGNIKDSRRNAALVTEHVLSRYLGLEERPNHTASVLVDEIHDQVKERASELLDRALSGKPKLRPDEVRNIIELVKSRWAATGYDGDYGRWVART